jgi:hypothetical protein
MIKWWPFSPWCVREKEYKVLGLWKSTHSRADVTPSYKMPRVVCN